MINGFVLFISYLISAIIVGAIIIIGGVWGIVGFIVVFFIALEIYERVTGTVVPSIHERNRRHRESEK